MDPVVDYRADHPAAHLTLNSPHNRNALSTALVTQLHEGLRRATEDPRVRMVVLGHTGGTFCAGADLSEASAGPPAERAHEMAALLRALIECPLPVIAMIDGHVRAGGMGLIGACDIVIAGPRCTFALTEARIGVAPAIISLTLLPKLSSRAAGRYFLTGETFTAATAAEIGLVTVATDDSATLSTTLAGFTESLSKGSPQGLAASKALTTASILADFDRNSDRLAADSARLFASEEALEGMLAFMQKRPPRWVQPSGEVND